VILSDDDIFCVDETWLKRQAPQIRWSDSGAQQRAAKAGKRND
jgi:hypothetical protein